MLQEASQEFTVAKPLYLSRIKYVLAIYDLVNQIPMQTKDL